jgi:hypothetical protein
MGRGSEDNSRLRKGDRRNLLLSVGGDDGATDIAVGGHGIQLPPGRPTMAGERTEREEPTPQAQNSLNKARNTSVPATSEARHPHQPLP